jgi:hypothetical protein
MPCPSNSPGLIIFCYEYKLFSAASYYFIPVGSKYSLQRTFSNFLSPMLSS